MNTKQRDKRNVNKWIAIGAILVAAINTGAVVIAAVQALNPDMEKLIDAPRDPIGLAVVAALSLSVLAVALLFTVNWMRGDNASLRKLADGAVANSFVLVGLVMGASATTIPVLPAAIFIGGLAFTFLVAGIFGRYRIAQRSAS